MASGVIVNGTALRDVAAMENHHRTGLLGGIAAVLSLLGGCGGGGEAGAPPPAATVPVSRPQQPPPPIPDWSGYFVGTITIAGQIHFADALITEERELRLYVGGPGAASGAIQYPRPASSIQFIGLANLGANSGSATG